MAVFEQAITHSPDRFELYANGGTAALDALDGNKALSWFKAGLAIRPSSPELLNNLGLLYDRAEGGRHQEALHYYQHALQLLPTHAQVREG